MTTAQATRDRVTGTAPAAGCVLTLFALALIVPARADDWPQWRGPQRNGITPEKLSLEAWPADVSPKVAWRAQVGKGHSAVVVQSGRAFTMGWDGRQDTVWCLAADTGLVLWSYAYPCGDSENTMGRMTLPEPTKLALPFSVAHAVMLWCLLTPAALGDDWPNWRGPDRDDRTNETSGYNGGAWPGKQLWRVHVGEGGSSPIVAGGNVYTLGFDAKSSQDLVRCLDAATGAERWTQRYKSRRFGRHATGDQGLYSGASATPEFDPSTKLLYTLGTDGDLNCWATDRRGERVWGLNLYEAFKAPRRPKADGTRAGQRDYGYITAPLVHGDWLLVAVGAADGHLMAFNKRTGKHLWSSEARDPAGHCGGLAPITVDGKLCVAVLSINHLLVIRLDQGNEGRTLAKYPWPTDFANNIASPAVVGNEVLITSGYNRKKLVKLQITPSGAQKVWESDDYSSICTPVIDGPHVYFVRRKMVCLDLATGKTVWTGGSFGDAASLVLTADGRLVGWTGDGDLTLADSARLSPKSYRELASRKKLFRSDAWPHVVLAEGRLYLKDREGNLACVAVK